MSVPSGGSCAPGICTRGRYTLARTCNGAGTCLPAVTVSCGKYQCNPQGCLTMCADDNDCVTASICGVVYCGGLRGEYFVSMNPTGTPKLVRTDPSVNFDFAGVPVAPGFNVSFSARWTGTVTPRFSETFVFSTKADDGVRLWIDNQLLIDDWKIHSSQENAGVPVPLVAGMPYEITLEYFNAAVGGSVQLLWSSPSTPKQVIPIRDLTPALP